MGKKQYLIFIVICCLLSVVMAYFLFFKEDAQHTISLTFVDKGEFKVGEEIDPLSLIQSASSTKILTPSVDTSTPGDKSLIYTVIDEEGHQKQFEKKIKIVAIEPPILQLKQEKVILEYGTSFDLKNNVKKAYDTFDKELEAIITGNYNKEKAGTYNITYKVTNSSRLSTQKTLTIIVKDKAVEETVPDKDKDVQKTETNTNEITNNKANNNEKENVQDFSTTSNNESNQMQSNPYSGQTEFRFTEGSTFEQVRQQCMIAGQSSNRSYTCDVIYDGEIATGYRLILN